MDYQEFLTKVIDKGIQAAKKDYKHFSQEAILKGSIAGFEACRGKNPLELSQLLKQVKDKMTKISVSPKSHRDLTKYWENRGYELEIKWVCNVVSAVLMNEKKPTIIPPTARAFITASEIVGIKKWKQQRQQ